MKVKTSELIDTALDWAVAKCEGHDWFLTTPGNHLCVWKKCPLTGYSEESISYGPSHNWAQGGPIIDRMIDEGYLIQKADFGLGVKCFQLLDGLCQFAYGPTPLIAVMRRLVTSKLGDEIDIPEELK